MKLSSPLSDADRQRVQSALEKLSAAHPAFEAKLAAFATASAALESAERMSELLALAHTQIQDEVAGFLAPYFAQGRAGAAYLAGQTELQGYVTGELTRVVRNTSFSLVEAVQNAALLLSVLEKIAADEDFFSLPTAAAKAA